MNSETMGQANQGTVESMNSQERNDSMPQMYDRYNFGHLLRLITILNFFELYEK